MGHRLVAFGVTGSRRLVTETATIPRGPRVRERAVSSADGSVVLL